MLNLIELQWLIIGLTWIIRYAVCQTNNCYDLYIHCNKQMDNCFYDLKILSMKCGDFNDPETFKYCKRSVKEVCQSAIKTMQIKNRFQGCQCNKYNYYDSRYQKHKYCYKIKQILNEHPCLKKSIALMNKQPVDQKIYSLVKTNGLRYTLGSIGIYAEQDLNHGKKWSKQKMFKYSCLEFKKKCERNPNCSGPLKKFLLVNKFEDCKTDIYINWYQILRSHKMFECTCFYYFAYARQSLLSCLKVQSRVRDNKCLSFLNMRVMYQTIPHDDLDKLDSGKPTAQSDDSLLKQISRLEIKEPNCNKPYHRCVLSTDCLKRFFDIKNKCNCSSGTQYQYKSCLKAVRSFYSRPELVTYNAIRCRCSSELSAYNGQNYKDSTCVKHKSVFQPQCVIKPPVIVRSRSDDSVNCLFLMKQCLNFSSCLDSFAMFNEECGWHQLQTADRCDRMKYIRCLDAYRSLWGSLLTTKCSCFSSFRSQTMFSPDSDDPLESKDVCMFFQKLLRPPRCIQNKNIQVQDNDKRTNYSITYYCKRITMDKTKSRYYLRMDIPSSTESNACDCNSSKCTKVTGSASLLLHNLTQKTCAFTRMFRHSPRMDKLYNQGPCSCNSLGFTCSMVYQSDMRIPNTEYEYLDTGFSLKFNYDLGKLIEFSRFRLPILPHGFYTVATELNKLMWASPGFTSCEIDMKIGDNKYLMFILFLKMKKTQLKQTQSSTWNMRPKWRVELSNRETIEQLNKECIMSILFLQASINGRYGDVVHSFPLSILLKAEVIKPKPQFNLFEDLKPTQSPNSRSHSSSNFNNSSITLVTHYSSLTILLSAVIQIIMINFSTH